MHISKIAALAATLALAACGGQNSETDGRDVADTMSESFEECIERLTSRNWAEDEAGDMCEQRMALIEFQNSDAARRAKKDYENGNTRPVTMADIIAERSR